MKSSNKKFFSNDYAAADSVAVLLFFFILSLTFSSAAIAWFSQEIYGESSVGVINFPTGAQSYTQEQNFQGCEINKTTWLAPKFATWTSVCGIGEVLTDVDLIGAWGWLLLDNEVPTENGIVSNNYVINNTPLQPYTIVLRYTASLDQNEIRVDTDGFHIPNYVLPSIGASGRGAVAIGDLFFYPYSGASTIQNVNIQTTYNNIQNSVIFTFNGQELFTTYALKGEGINPLGIFKHYYGGVASYSIGFTIANFITSNQITLSSDSSFLNMVINFIGTMLQIIVWTVPDEMLPLVLNIILIKTQLAGIIVCIIVLARG